MVLSVPFPGYCHATVKKKKKKHLCCSAWERIGGVSLALEPVPEGTVMEWWYMDGKELRNEMVPRKFA